MSDTMIIILSRSTLEAIGLRKVLEEEFGIKAHIGDDSFFEAIKSCVEPDIFFVDERTFMTNLGFFLPRKTKTVVLTKGDTSVEDVKTLNALATQDLIVSELNRIFSTGSQDNRADTALSAREIEVLRLIASGCINKEIAQELNISINTVLTHRKNLTSKLGIKSVSGLSFYAMMNGIV